MKLKLNEQFLSVDFQKEFKKTKDLDIKYKLLGLISLQKTHNYRETAIEISVSKETIRKWYLRYENSGISGLKKRKSGSSKERIKPIRDQINYDDLKAFIQSRSGKGGSLTGKDIKRYLLETQNVDSSLATVYKLLHSLDYSYQTVRSIHPKTDPQKQEDFKKTSKNS